MADTYKCVYCRREFYSGQTFRCPLLDGRRVCLYCCLKRCSHAKKICGAVQCTLITKEKKKEREKSRPDETSGYTDNQITDDEDDISFRDVWYFFHCDRNGRDFIALKFTLILSFEKIL